MGGMGGIVGSLEPVSLFGVDRIRLIATVALNLAGTVTHALQQFL